VKREEVISDTREADPLYHWMGLDSPLMFAAHKAAGGMTSVYRQLGIGCERIFRQVLQDELELTDAQVAWSNNFSAPRESSPKIADVWAGSYARMLGSGGG